MNQSITSPFLKISAALAIASFVVYAQTTTLTRQTLSQLKGSDRRLAQQALSQIRSEANNLGVSAAVELVKCAASTPFSDVRGELLNQVSLMHPEQDEIAEALVAVAGRRDLNANFRLRFADLLYKHPPKSPAVQKKILRVISSTSPSVGLATSLTWALSLAKDPQLVLQMRKTAEKLADEQPSISGLFKFFDTVRSGQQFHALIQGDREAREAARANLEVLFDAHDPAHWNQLAYQLRLSKAPQLWDFAAARIRKNSPSPQNQLPIAEALSQGDAEGRAKLADAFAAIRPTHRDVQKALLNHAELFRRQGDLANSRRTLAALSEGLDAYLDARRKGILSEVTIDETDPNRAPYPLTPDEQQRAKQVLTDERPTPRAEPKPIPKKPKAAAAPRSAKAEKETGAAPKTPTPETAAEVPPAEEREPAPVSPRDPNVRVRLYKRGVEGIDRVLAPPPDPLHFNLGNEYDEAIAATPRPFHARSIDHRLVIALNNPNPEVRLGAIVSLGKQRRWARDVDAADLLRLADQTRYPVTRDAILDWLKNNPRPDSPRFQSVLIELASQYDANYPHRLEMLRMLAEDRPIDPVLQKQMLERYPNVLEGEAESLFKEAMSKIRERPLVRQLAQCETDREVRRQVAAGAPQEALRVITDLNNGTPEEILRAAQLILKSPQRPLPEPFQFGLLGLLRSRESQLRNLAAQYFAKYPPTSSLMQSQMFGIWKLSDDLAVNRLLKESAMKIQTDDPSIKSELAEAMRVDAAPKKKTWPSRSVPAVSCNDSKAKLTPKKEKPEE